MVSGRYLGCRDLWLSKVSDLDRRSSGGVPEGFQMGLGGALYRAFFINYYIIYRYIYI